MLNKVELLRIFCAAAESDSFKAAAVRLGISPQAVTRAVQQLEQSTGEVLFHRSTRHIRLTRFAEGFAIQAKHSLQQLDALFQQHQAVSNHTIAGLVRLAAPKVIRPILMPVLSALAQQHPALQLDLRLSDQLADVVDEQIDVGVRIGLIRDNSFIARKVADVGLFLTASPLLLSKYGVPLDLEQLAELPTTALMDKATGRAWHWYFQEGQLWSPKKISFVADDSETEADATLAGLGVSQLASCMAIPHLRTGALVRLLPGLDPKPWPLSVYRPQRGPVPERVRLVFDTLIKALSDKDIFPEAP
ncbi:MAG: LysR family transcriptional regulator [Gammaproteobacteria bacterium]|nr:LysR family transcriptional regulator [Gammaproteobacteria bacterium]MBU2056286.1 LysR family transcriptional regulator [Gammaproteobacteria bacterium]MBU2175760.1 LysR family transcriptional regulator [Gammaproteobacteria bacterium]MBU2246612.1 LysR family transcriptional regulator [Gammaproteobacteria bacterium]MBU2346394.1 LysR family transcriptional regulator [Gammaproteobacteria bacterium]